MEASTMTTTFATVGNSSPDGMIREWEHRLADGSEGEGRYMNAVTVSTLTKGIRDDDGMMNLIVATLVRPRLTHQQMIAVYRSDGTDPSVSEFLRTEMRGLFSPNPGIDYGVVSRARSDIEALKRLGETDGKTDHRTCMRTSELLAFIAWLTGDDDEAGRQLRDAAVHDVDGTGDTLSSIVRHARAMGEHPGREA